RLAERGRIDLDAPVSSVVRDFPYPEITIRHCLQHVSGLPSGPEFFGRHPEIRASHEVVGNPEVMSFLSRERPALDGDPGTRFVYSNIGFIVLATVIEDLTGESYASALSRHVFEPAGMTGTVVLDGGVEPGPGAPSGLACAYVREDGAWTRVGRADPDAWGFVRALGGTVGDGGATGTVRDLARFGHALASGDLVSAASLRSMLESLRLVDGTIPDDVTYVPSTFGLGTYVMPGGDILWHTGDWGGYRAGLFVNVSNGVVVAYALNRAPTDYAWFGTILELVNGG
ncbi:MAG: serine hydrolase, partial [Phycisphaerales bacterium]|nr:serine hydrolase [Phycisphaerales bacterium]